MIMENKEIMEKLEEGEKDMEVKELIENMNLDVEEEEELQPFNKCYEDQIDSFMTNITSHMYEPIPTGFKPFDDLIGGGFEKGTLVTLLAAPATGKTMLTQQLFESAAANGSNVIYVNLEMSRDQLLSRSIVRIAAEKGYEITTKDVKRGYLWDNETRAIVEYAVDKYKKDIAPHLNYKELEENNLSDLMEKLGEEYHRVEELGFSNPMIVIDYVHLLKVAYEPEGTATVKQVITQLKDFALKHKTVVFGIAATNRESIKNGTITMSDGRDSSSLEYSGDIILGLNYAELAKGNNKDKDVSVSWLASQPVRKMQLELLKVRDGEHKSPLFLDYIPKKCRFEESNKKKEPVNKKKEPISNIFELKKV